MSQGVVPLDGGQDLRDGVLGTADALPQTEVVPGVCLGALLTERGLGSGNAPVLTPSRHPLLSGGLAHSEVRSLGRRVFPYLSTHWCVVGTLC